MSYERRTQNRCIWRMGKDGIDPVPTATLEDTRTTTSMSVPLTIVQFTCLEKHSVCRASVAHGRMASVKALSIIENREIAEIDLYKSISCSWACLPPARTCSSDEHSGVDILAVQPAKVRATSETRGTTHVHSALATSGGPLTDMDTTVGRLVATRTQQQMESEPRPLRHRRPVLRCFMRLWSAVVRLSGGEMNPLARLRISPQCLEQQGPNAPMIAADRA
ncbi:hypothetical protein CAPTEDRAFT_186150 [Capitella teleta]|uniref:Uncharacterized protein n=1 Tax=Capitella teleta TaxID=283909 RepID=R7UBW2_CAPTE|nr:hypothetical protein CAPTEDRAFT_186150 [Capitella teleta]|eukprot:ELU03596.1 hypothetical protein CAPTEDRAFT_186150 [Capitella teleta]